MPLLKQWTPGKDAKAAIWKIEEPESFFAEFTGLDVPIKNDKRRTEHLAGRFLLKYLENDFPIEKIQKDEHDKPRIENNSLFFSISHSWPYVAAIIDKQRDAGIDLQTWHSKIQQLQHKFLSPREQQLFHNDARLLALAWSAKEAAYKYAGNRGVDFIEQLPITFFNLEGEKSNMSININLFEKNQKVIVISLLSDDFVTSYVHFT